MPPPPLGGTVWLGMGSPKARSFRASEAWIRGQRGETCSSQACSPQKLRANRKVPVQTQESGKETLGLRAEGTKARALTEGGGQGRPKTSPACSITLIAWPWYPTCHRCDGGYRSLTRVCLPALHPPAVPASPT
ncbi:dexamethasone-induced protein isoform X3 [Elephas maximus indicus]|uniref:dexamethasone-induced protein isoform X3 n=1 Tax=Elephas maximus indicus TaxID=99487 RepID=UPI0021167A9B|nr:dexamethasone-induced protein isoform X3 [Elephas maximus indicus]